MTARPPGPFGFPIMVEVRDVPVFVAGGGREAAGKVKALAGLGAKVRLWVADQALASEPGDRTALPAHSGPFDPALLDGARLAIIDTGDRALDRRIAGEARRHQVLVNVVDDPESCDWSAPAILRRGDLTIAIATAGVAPALASRLRDQLRDVVGPEYRDLVDIFAEMRPRIMASGRSLADRRRLWYSLVDGQALDHLRAGRGREARDAISGAIESWETAR
ncbi:MAG: bifunctional precorrin-2 dehydrogenase/sirohydrochlorin ferrochelatase [Chloroflexi bacterium]|nr:bifunctional precorrin-2 dehydrogenase/sirohydrochlorin ferrochelatase [Chloroflexota bacterium]